MQWEKRPEEAPNVNAMTDHFNRVSLWVATQIAREESPKQQAKVVAKFIKVAEHLMTIRNYNSAVQIMSGLSNVAIQRLKRLQKVSMERSALSCWTLRLTRSISRTWTPKR